VLFVLSVLIRELVHPSGSVVSISFVIEELPLTLSSARFDLSTKLNEPMSNYWVNRVSGTRVCRYQEGCTKHQSRGRTICVLKNEVRG
jgi:hypothetical protein